MHKFSAIPFLGSHSCNNYFEILGAEGGATAVIDEAAFDEDLFEDEDLDDLEDELNNLEV